MALTSMACEDPPEPALHEDPARTTPIGVLRFASEYLEAALAAEAKMATKATYGVVAPIPVLFLVGQSIELSLKAYLLSEGVSLRKLRYKYGHELYRSLRKAKELGLYNLVEFSVEELSAVELLNQLYSSKQLQYIVTGAKTFPAFAPLAKMALKVCHAVGAKVGYRPKNIPNAL